MFAPSIIFQRTHSGRAEIRQKSYGLTQSERLVLIMVDGTTTCQEMRSELSSLTDERFERALNTLQKKELIVEIFLPLEGQAAEELEKAVIERFLQQDPLDPVTVLMQDPDEELGFLAPSATAPATGAAMDETHIRLADSLAEEVKASRAGRTAQAERAPRVRSSMPEQSPTTTTPSRPVFSKVHWGYWLIAIGLAFIAGYFFPRIGG